MKTAVIGAGAWGTALANLLAGKGVDTLLWAREPALAEAVNTGHENPVYFPGVPLDPRLRAVNVLEEACRDAEVFLIVVPAQYCRNVLQKLKPHLPRHPAMVCASKGIELTTLSPLSTVFAEALDGLKPRYAHLSGPSFASELSSGAPTAVALGCEDKSLAQDMQELFATDYFRVYTNPDFRGVELGGAVKNIIAIAAGVSDGLDFGHNTRAALITRGLSEMSRLGEAMGADKNTFTGLSGMGDLVLTCTGDLSRNRQVGLRIGRGESLVDIISGMKAVAEGVKTAEAVYKLARRIKVDVPITEQVHAILYLDKDPAEAVRDLMGRELKEE